MKKQTKIDTGHWKPSANQFLSGEVNTTKIFTSGRVRQDVREYYQLVSKRVRKAIKIREEKLGLR